MRSILLFCCACTAPGGNDTGGPSGPDTVVHVVRHFEKQADGTTDPSLSKQGVARSWALRDHLADTPLAAVFATEFVRTQETVAPTAAAHDLAVDTRFEPTHELADHILSVHGGEIVLVAGHTDTVPDLLGALGVRGADRPSIGRDDYGELFTTTVSASGDATVESVLIERVPRGD